MGVLRYDTDYLSILNATVEAGQVGSWHQITLLLFLFASKIPHMCKTLWQGVMFAVAVATWCNLTGDPVQTRHQGIPPLADATAHYIATGKLSGTTVVQQGRDQGWKERGQLYFVLE